jgi:hypothetical protein
MYIWISIYFIHFNEVSEHCCVFVSFLFPDKVILSISGQIPTIGLYVSIRKT